MKDRYESKKMEVKVLSIVLGISSACLMVSAVDTIDAHTTGASMLFAFIGIMGLFVSGVVYLSNTHD